MSDLEQFLKHSVEDYLLEDLETLKSARPSEGKRVGGVGYPLLITTFAGIELLGNLVSSSAFDPFKGAERFAEFWRLYLYSGDPARAAAASQLYKLARHGLAHAFVVKGNFEVWKGNNSQHLVKTAAGAVSIDAAELASDFRRAYETKVKPHVVAGDALAMTMAANLAAMQTEYDKQARALIGNIVLPTTGPSSSFDTMLLSTTHVLQGPSGPAFPPIPPKSTR